MSTKTRKIFIKCHLPLSAGMSIYNQPLICPHTPIIFAVKPKKFVLFSLLPN